MSHSLTTFEEFVHTHSFHQTTWYYLITPLDRSAHTQLLDDLCTQPFTTACSTELTGTSGSSYCKASLLINTATLMSVM